MCSTSPTTTSRQHPADLEATDQGTTFAPADITGSVFGGNATFASDVAGDTLVSKPVVDAQGDLFVLANTSTSAQFTETQVTRARHPADADGANTHNWYWKQNSGPSLVPGAPNGNGTGNETFVLTTANTPETPAGVAAAAGSGSTGGDRGSPRPADGTRHRLGLTKSGHAGRSRSVSASLSQTSRPGFG
jgi:hypothetical protein